MVKAALIEVKYPLSNERPLLALDKTTKEFSHTVGSLVMPD